MPPKIIRSEAFLTRWVLYYTHRRINAPHISCVLNYTTENQPKEEISYIEI